MPARISTQSNKARSSNLVQQVDESSEDSLWRRLNMMMSDPTLDEIQRQYKDKKAKESLFQNMVEDAKFQRQKTLWNRTSGYGKRGENYKGEGIPIKDTRTVDAITGKPVTDRNNMNSIFDAKTARMIVRHSLRNGIDPKIPLTIAFQETGGAPQNPMMNLSLYDKTTGWENEDYFIGKSVDFLKNKYKEAKDAGITDPMVQLQYYNGLKKPQNGNRYYGIDISAIKSFRETPLYAKRIMDLMKVIEGNPAIQKIIKEEKGM